EFLETGESADGKFAYPVAVRYGEQVVAQFSAKGFVLAGDLGHVAVFDDDGHRMLKDTIFLGEVVAEHITDKNAINSRRSGEDFTFGQVAPLALFRVTPVAGHPFPVFVEGGGHIATPGRGSV